MAVGDRFDRESKITIVREVTEKGRAPEAVAEEFALSGNTVRKWIRQYQADPQNAFPGSGHRQSQGPEADELLRLKRRIKELEEENAFLQRVSVYFAKPPKNTRK
jgi:transposase